MRELGAFPREPVDDALAVIGKGAGDGGMRVAAAAVHDGAEQTVGLGQDRKTHDVADAGRVARAARIVVFETRFEDRRGQAQFGGTARRHKSGESTADGNDVKLLGRFHGLATRMGRRCGHRASAVASDAIRIWTSTGADLRIFRRRARARNGTRIEAAQSAAGLTSDNCSSSPETTPMSVFDGAREDRVLELVARVSPNRDQAAPRFGHPFRSNARISTHGSKPIAEATSKNSSISRRRSPPSYFAT